MGKGDIKSKKGKRTAGSYGVSRKKKKSAETIVKKTPKKAKATTAEKTTADTSKKTASKKTSTVKTATTNKASTTKTTTAKKTTATKNLLPIKQLLRNKFRNTKKAARFP
tara:strand:- start:115 stop:444 length:330 start_codon:yes stop_codon:yes gene_type:complete